MQLGVLKLEKPFKCQLTFKHLIPSWKSTDIFFKMGISLSFSKPVLAYATKHQGFFIANKFSLYLYKAQKKSDQISTYRQDANCVSAHRKRSPYWLLSWFICVNFTCLVFVDFLSVLFITSFNFTQYFLREFHDYHQFMNLHKKIEATAMRVHLLRVTEF